MLLPLFIFVVTVSRHDSSEVFSSVDSATSLGGSGFFFYSLARLALVPTPDTFLHLSVHFVTLLITII